MESLSSRAGRATQSKRCPEWGGTDKTINFDTIVLTQGRRCARAHVQAALFYSVSLAATRVLSEHCTTEPHLQPMPAFDVSPSQPIHTNFRINYEFIFYQLRVRLVSPPFFSPSPCHQGMEFCGTKGFSTDVTTVLSSSQYGDSCFHWFGLSRN